MDITVDAIITRYNAEISKLTQRAILAEARAEAAEAALKTETATEEAA